MRTTYVRALVLIIAVAIIGTILWLGWLNIDILTDREKLSQAIQGAGVWAPLVYIALQALQIVVTPIPATVVTLAGGYAFETVWASVYSMIGTTIGFFVVFVISKKFGRRLLQALVSEEKMTRYDKIASSKGMLAFVVFGFLFPFLPDSVVGYIAGLTPMRISSLVILSVVT